VRIIPYTSYKLNVFAFPGQTRVSARFHTKGESRIWRACCTICTSVFVTGWPSICIVAVIPNGLTRDTLCWLLDRQYQNDRYDHANYEGYRPLRNSLCGSDKIHQSIREGAPPTQIIVPADKLLIVDLISFRQQHIGFGGSILSSTGSLTLRFWPHGDLSRVRSSPRLKS
jgi:hypothetical protein